MTWRRLLYVSWVSVVVLASLPGRAGATVTTSTRSVTVAPCAGETVITVPFPFTQKGQLLVTKELIATGATEALTLNEDYTVTLPAGTTNGKVTLTAACSSSYNLTIERIVSVEQPRSFRSQGAFYPYQVEQALDEIVMMIQQIIANAGTDATTAVNTHEAKPDPHTQYAKLTGRSGSQHLRGGTGASENMRISSTVHATKGKIFLGSTDEFVVDETNNRIGINTLFPQHTLDIGSGDMLLGIDLLLDRNGISRTVDNDLLYLSGSSSLDTGYAMIRIHGQNYASDPNDIYFYADDFYFSDENRTLIFTLDESGLTGATGASITVSSSDYIQTPVLRGSAEAGGSLTLRSTANEPKGSIFFGSDSVYDEANGRLGIGTTSPDYSLHVRGQIFGRLIDTSSTALCADSGDANPAKCTDTDAAAHGLVVLMCNDGDGCIWTLSETDAVGGMRYTVVNISTNTVTLADEPGVQETAATTLGQYDSATLIYATDRWIQTSASDN